MASGGFDMNALMDALAKRVADEVCARLSQGSTGATVKPRPMTVEQAATYLGRSKEAVEHMIARGKLAVVRSDRRVFPNRPISASRRCAPSQGLSRR